MIAPQSWVSRLVEMPSADGVAVPYGFTLATGSWDGMVLLWEYNSKTFPLPGSIGNADSH